MKSEARELTAEQAYWQLWRQGQRPDLVAFLATRPGLTPSRAAEVIAIDQYERWTSGERVGADVYLRLLPEGPDHDQAACDVVYGEILLREQLGEHPDAEAYKRQFSSLVDLLTRQLDLHQALGVEPPRVASPVSPTTRHGQMLLGKLPITLPQIAGYEVLEQIGKGGMGVVYKARQVSLHRVVALKVVEPPPGSDASSLERMRQEARNTARLSHPNIVMVHDAGLAGSSFYLAMEYVRGTDLHRLVDQRGPLPVATACEYLRQAALGLQHAHDQGLVHRDIKPSNLIVAEAAGGGSAVVKILDLGLARLVSGEVQADHVPITQVGAFMGTPDFIAPEQANDPRLADARSDLYSLGCTFYYVLTGQVPFPAVTPLAKLVQHHLEDAKPIRQLRPEIPAAVAGIVGKLMSKRPQDRFQTALELARALEFPAPPRPGPRSVEAQRKLVGHKDRVRGLAFSPDGRTLASAGADRKVMLWPRDGDAEPAALKGHTAGVACVAFHPDGRSLVCGADDGSLYCWDLQSRSLQGRSPGHANSVSCLVVARSGGMLLTGGHDGFLRSWDTVTGQPIREWAAHGGPIWGLALMPDDRTALSGGQDRGLRLWDVVKGESLALFPEQAMLVTCANLSPDGKLALTGGIDGVIHVWDVDSQRKRGTLEGHEGRVTSLAFSPDGRQAISGSRDQTVRLWDIHDGKPLATFRDHTRWVTCVAWDGELVASGGLDAVVYLRSADAVHG